MSKTKEYLNNLEDQGVDVLGDDMKDLDLDFQIQVEEEQLSYYYWLEQVNSEDLENDSLENWK